MKLETNNLFNDYAKATNGRLSIDGYDCLVMKLDQYDGVSLKEASKDTLELDDYLIIGVHNVGSASNDYLVDVIALRSDIEDLKEAIEILILG